jgi:hypothetical protein
MRMMKLIALVASTLVICATAWWFSIPDECRYDDRLFQCNDYLGAKDPKAIDWDGGP